MSDQAQCVHPIENSQFLTTYEQVHLDNPETHAMLACLFLCKDCGKIYASNVELIRGYLPSGDVPPELQKVISKRKTEIAVEQRAHQLAAQLIKNQEKKS